MKGFIAVLLLVVAVAAENQCPTEQADNWEIEKLLRHEDCDKFYKCTFGEPVAQDCPSGLYFNLENNECDWANNVDCSGRNDPANPTPEESEETTAKPDEETQSTTSVKPETTTSVPVTSAVPETTTTAKPNTTTSVPVTTVAPETTTTAKPNTTTSVPVTTVAPETNTTTNPETTPEVPETTSQSNGTTAAPESEEDGDTDGDGEESDIELLENGCPVDPHIHWLLPNEEDCNLFYYCVWGEKVPRQCPSSLHFNRVLQVCDWPSDAGCAVSANRHYGARAQVFRNV